MPIEFACPACQKLLSAPDGSGGQACLCPECQAVAHIPVSSAEDDNELIEITEVYDDSAHKSAVGQSIAAAKGMPVSADMLTIACPRCQHELRCARSLQGTKGQCRNCQHIFTITDAARAPSAAVLSDSPDLVFHCPACDQLFAGETQMEGRKGKCHTCGEVFVIKLQAATSSLDSPSRVTSPSPPSAPQRPSPPVPTPAPPPAAVVPTTPQAPIQFDCPSCAGVMEVPGSSVGQRTLCPYCQTTITIPNRPSLQTAQPTVRPIAATPSAARMYPPQTARPTVSAATATSTPGLWAELGDMSGAASANPYAVPAVDLTQASASVAGASTSGAGASAAMSDWDVAPRRKRLRGLTFSNAFQLTFNSLFPQCLFAPVLFLMVGVVCFVMLLTAGFLSNTTIRSMQLEPGSMAIEVVVYGLLGTAIFMSVCLVTLAYCMVCNTALHAVRGKKITAHISLNPGESYGGVLAIMVGWTLFNVLRQQGVPWVLRQMVANGQAESVPLVAISLIGLFAVIQIVLTFGLAFVPFALLDGQDLGSAIGTSFSVFLNHILVALPVMICGWLLYLIVGTLTLGIGFILLCGAFLYLYAAIYHLAED